MKKISSGMKAMVAGLAMLAVSATAAPAAEQPGFETYVVRHGDTLSKIAGRIYGDASRWREILKENPQVTNANRIYPGDILHVPIREAAAPAGEAAGQLTAREGAAAAEPAVIAEPPVAVPEHVAAAAEPAAGEAAPGGPAEGAAAASGQQAVQAPAVVLVNPALQRSAGYLADALPAIGIVAAQDERLILGTGEAAIINAAVVPGQRFTVVNADRRIYHPITGASLGWLVRVIGTAEVTCRGRKTSTVVLIGMRDGASVGDYLVPLDPHAAPAPLAGKEKPVCLPPGNADGVIVAFDEDHIAGGEGDIVYIDRGSSTGVTTGGRFDIYRRVAPEGRATVGELQVLRVGERASAALVTNSLEPLQVGDLLRAR